MNPLPKSRCDRETIGIEGGVEGAVGVEEVDVAAESAARPAPAIQIDPSLPLGVRFSTAVCANVDSLYAISQPV